MLEDGEQNDAIEALELLMGVVVAQQRKAFLTAMPQHAALDAWHALQHAAAGQSSGVRSPKEQPHATPLLHGTLPRVGSGQISAEPLDAGHAQDNSQDTTDVCTQQAPKAPAHGDLLQEWQSVSRVPLEGTLLEELACARCRGLSRTHAAPMLALLLNLPTVQVPHMMHMLQSASAPACCMPVCGQCVS